MLIPLKKASNRSRLNRNGVEEPKNLTGQFQCLDFGTALRQGDKAFVGDTDAVGQRQILQLRALLADELDADICHFLAVGQIQMRQVGTVFRNRPNTFLPEQIIKSSSTNK